MNVDAPAENLGIDITTVQPQMAAALGVFFEALVAEGADRQFHPHPLTHQQAQVIAEFRGNDYYCIAIDEAGRVAAYGMLRGWDEGFEIPSLGIAVLGSCRRRGFGDLMLSHLHSVARRRGASRVRLTVDRSNEAAVRLYARVGYVMKELDATRLEGFYEIS